MQKTSKLLYPVFFRISIPQVVQFGAANMSVLQYLDALDGGAVPAAEVCSPSFHPESMLHSRKADEDFLSYHSGSSQHKFLLCGGCRSHCKENINLDIRTYKGNVRSMAPTVPI